MGRRQAGRGDTGSCHSAQERLRWQASPPALRVPLLSGTLPDGKSARVKMASGAVRGTVPGGAGCSSHPASSGRETEAGV